MILYPFSLIQDNKRSASFIKIKSQTPHRILSQKGKMGEGSREGEEMLFHSREVIVRAGSQHGP